jgi:hypothetical protein
MSASDPIADMLPEGSSERHSLRLRLFMLEPNRTTYIADASMRQLTQQPASYWAASYGSLIFGVRPTHIAHHKL